MNFKIPISDKHKPPQIRISPGSDEVSLHMLDTIQLSTVQIMIESPKEPPRGDFSTEIEVAQQQQQQQIPTSIIIQPAIEEPIDVNIQGDTSKVFYDYNPEEANEIVVLETLTEESPKSEDIPALPDIPVPTSFDFSKEIITGTEQLTTTTTPITTATSTTTATTNTTTILQISDDQPPQQQQPISPVSPTTTTSTTTPSIQATSPASSTTSPTTSLNDDDNKDDKIR